MNWSCLCFVQFMSAHYHCLCCILAFYAGLFYHEHLQWIRCFFYVFPIIHISHYSSRFLIFDCRLGQTLRLLRQQSKGWWCRMNARRLAICLVQWISHFLALKNWKSHLLYIPRILRSRLGTVSNGNYADWFIILASLLEISIQAPAFLIPSTQTSLLLRFQRNKDATCY